MKHIQAAVVLDKQQLDFTLWLHNFKCNMCNINRWPQTVKKYIAIADNPFESPQFDVPVILVSPQVDEQKPLTVNIGDIWKQIAKKQMAR